MRYLNEWVLNFHISNHRWPTLREAAEKFPEIFQGGAFNRDLTHPEEIIIKPSERTPNENPNHRK